MEVTLKNVSMHFNKGAILTPAEKFQKKLLDKFGGYCKKVQRNSMRRGRPGQVSAIGKPPLRHARNLDIKYSVYSFTDVKKKSVVIGMVLAPSAVDGDPPMPGQLEYGGIDRYERGKKRHQTERRKKVLVIRPRPSANPAFKKTIDKQLPDLIKGGIMKEV